MKWNGIVSQRPQRSMATTFATANANQASSSFLVRKSVAHATHGLDRRVVPELLANAAHADVDDVGTGIEVVPPHLRKQALAANDLARMLGEANQEPELSLGEVD